MSRFIIWEIKISCEILYKIVDEVVDNAIANFQLFYDDAFFSFIPERSTRKSLRQNDVISSEKTCSSVKTQETFTCSKSIVETVEKSEMFDFIDDVLVFLLLTLNIFYTFAGIVYDIGLVSPSYFTNIYLVDAGERVVFYFYF